MGKQKRVHLWLLAIAFPLVALAVVLIPLLIIQPFKAQEAGALEYALALKRFGPWLAILSLIASLTVSRRLRRWPAYLATTLTLIFTGAGFVNVFEIMFKPIDEATFAKATDARLDDDDMVLAVKLGGVARAYPVRTMAYHHILNDTVNNVPIVATY